MTTSLAVSLWAFFPVASVLLTCAPPVAFASARRLDTERAPAAAPLPPQRPSNLEGQGSKVAAKPTVVAGDAQCTDLMASGHVAGRVEAPVLGLGGCGIASPVRISAIVLPGGQTVAVQPPALVRCAFASVLADWVREDLAPATIRAGENLTAIEEAGAYECRTRDRIAGATLSEHSKGDALDISALAARAGPFFVVAQNPKTALARQFRDTACARFSTVLGPGADAYHADNVHLDLEARRHAAHICEWRLP